MLLSSRVLPDHERIWAHYMTHRARWTPDSAALYENKTWWLFVCDDHQSKHERFPSLIKHGPTLVPGYSSYPTVFTMSGFNLFFDSTSRHIVPLHAETDGFFPRAKIKGQLHLVSPDVLYSLDIHYQNGVLFRRRRVKLLLPYTTKPRGPWVNVTGEPLPRALRGWRGKRSPERVHIVEAYMYVGRQRYWDKQIDGGYNTLQCPIHFPNVEKNWLPRYYEFTRTFAEAQRPDR